MEMMAGGVYPHIRISGSPRERGRQYGELARERIHKSLVAYEMLFRHYSRIDWDDVRRRAREYLPAIEAYHPACLEEMAGIAEGGRVEFEDIVALNLRSELRFSGQVADLRHNMATAQDHQVSRFDGECTAVAALPSVTNDGQTLLAQNWDWATHTRETTIVLEVIRADGPNYVTLVEAGLLAKSGMNDRGLGLVTNTLVSNRDCGEPAVPYHVVLRSLLDATSISNAIVRILSPLRSSSANYLLASAEGLAVDAECLPGDSVAVRLHSPDEGLLVHSNHFICDPDPAIDLGLVLMPDSFFRLQRAKQLLAEPAPVTVSVLKALFSDHHNHPNGICSHEHEDEEEFVRSATIASLIMDLPARKLLIADGNPCQASWRELDFSQFLKE